MPPSTSVDVRIIPARAGFTSEWDEHWCSFQGSSPLARGLLVQDRDDASRFWIIPARAGFTVVTTQPAAGATDHPRSRGVYFHVKHASTDQTGSSPLARGLPTQSMHLRCYVRIIPARAGFTFCQPPTLCLLPDHPRSRGVYPDAAAKAASLLGSSPLARGLHHPAEPVGVDLGIIPARAGFTAPARFVGLSPGDHPRSRGVYVGRDEPK